MIFDAKKNGKGVVVFDAHGVRIGSCFKYNTKTKEVHMFLTGNKGGKSRVLVKTLPSPKGSSKWETLKVKIKIPGSYAELDGKRVA